MSAQLALDLRVTIPALHQEVLDRVADILPHGIPTYVRRIHDVRKQGGRLFADLEVFDGGRGTICISGQRGGSGYRWTSFQGDPFSWDGRAWKRHPEVAEVNDA